MSGQLGQSALAAYEPIGGCNWGLVVRVGLAELRAPHQEMAVLAFGIALLVILLGPLVLLVTVNPVIQGIVGRTNELRREVAERKQAEDTLRQYEFIVNASHDMMTLVDQDFHGSG